MIWNWSKVNTIVFSWWRTFSTIGIIFASLSVVLISFIYECISYWQTFQDREAASTEAQYLSLGIHDDDLVKRRLSGRFSRSLIYGLRCYVGIILMLIMMTFNGYLVFSIVIGSVFGHYFLKLGSTHH